MNSDQQLIVDDPVSTDILDSELARMLGMPSGRAFTGSMAELATLSRRWFQENVKPWSARRYFDIAAIDNESVLLKNGVRLNSPELARRFASTQPHGVVVIALSLGPESEEEATNRLNAGLPDEWIAIDAYGSALVESIRREECLKVCTWADEGDTTALSFYAPGYEGWPLSDQQVLFDLLDKDGGGDLRGRLTVHRESHMLWPLKSSFLVVGITRKQAIARMDTAYAVPCTSCAHPTCTLRRAPYQEREYPVAAEGVITAELTADLIEPVKPKQWEYAFPEKALKRWSTKLLTLKIAKDGTTHALFKLEGSICRHSSKRLVFDFKAALSPASDGHRILTISCSAAEEDEMFEMMCGASSLDKFLRVVEEHQPLLGEPLERAMAWKPRSNPGGCICLETHRDAKWLMVYQTIHYALESGLDDN